MIQGLNPAIERHRVSQRDHPMGSNSSYGNNGVFQIPMPDCGALQVIASDGLGWEHVSVTWRDGDHYRTPTWDEMCLIKDLFWGLEECVIQYHPPRSRYVNVHPHVLHLWKPIGVELPQPPTRLVGLR